MDAGLRQLLLLFDRSLSLKLWDCISTYFVDERLPTRVVAMPREVEMMDSDLKFPWNSNHQAAGSSLLKSRPPLPPRARDIWRGAGMPRDVRCDEFDCG
jgi:hypothetical protein